MSQAEPNPFQAPVETNVKSATLAPNNAGPDFSVIAKKWERYRLIYNGILILETIVLSALGIMFVGLELLTGLVLVAIAGALTVNFFFFLGPAFDGYCQWIFESRSNAFGLIILVLGLLFSMALAGVTIAGIVASVSFPNQL